MESKNLYTITATVRIKKGQGRTLKAGGAWIYDNEIIDPDLSFRVGNFPYLPKAHAKAGVSEYPINPCKRGKTILVPPQEKQYTVLVVVPF